MSRAIVTTILSCILMPKVASAQTVTVSGAGSSDMNGTYTACGGLNGKTKYCEGGTDNVIFWHSNQWIIAVETGPSSYSTRYNNYNNTSLPPDTGWQLSGGSNPPPTLSGDISHIPVTHTFVVNSTADDGDGNTNDGICSTLNGCTLRAAIQQANALNPVDPIEIEFNITTGTSSDRAWLIAPSSELPAIDRPILIDGETQPGSSCGVLTDGDQHVLWVKVDGAGVVPGKSGLTINTGGAGTVVRGLVVADHGHAGIQSYADSVTIDCSYIGTHEDGNADDGNGTHGVRIREGSGAIVSNSLISGNTWSGVQIETGASDAWIKGNIIGAMPITYDALQNDQAGITDTGQRTNIGGSPGGLDLDIKNIIAYNGLEGVRMTDSQTTASVVGNSIFSNGEMGIDLNDDGVDTNDFKDVDGGPNGLQNYLHQFFPVYLGGNMITVYIQLYSEPGRQYLVEFYEVTSPDASGYGEGDTPLSYLTLTTNTQGFAETITAVSRSGGWPPSTILSSTTTRIEFDRYGSTSEYTLARTATGPNVWLAGGLLLEGPYQGSGAMGTSTAFADALPGFHPFWESRYDGTRLDYDGWDAVRDIPAGAIDWILITLRNVNTETPAAPGTIETQKAVFLKDNGAFMDLDGTEGVGLFAPSGPDWYWIEIGHRNHIPIISNFAVHFDPSVTYDFSASMNQAYGHPDHPPMKNLGTDENGPFGLFACDVNIDGNVQALDFNDYLTATLSGAAGYVHEDCNLDGQVQALDFNLYLANTLAGASSQIP